MKVFLWLVSGHIAENLSKAVINKTISYQNIKPDPPKKSFSS